LSSRKYRLKKIIDKILSLHLTIALIFSSIAFTLPLVNPQVASASTTVTIWPNGIGDSAQHDQEPSSGSNWDKVNNNSNDSTQIFNTAGLRTDLYAVQNPSIPGGAQIVSIDVQVVMAGYSYDTSYNPWVDILAKDSSGTQSITGYASSQGSWTQLSTGAIQRNNGQAWTITELNNLQIGVLTDAWVDYGDEIYVSAVWAEVTYSTPPTVTLSSSAPTYTNTSPIPVTATFSENVTGFVSGDISVTNGSVSGFSGSGTTYTFNVTPSGQGAVTVNVPAGVATGASGSNTAATPLTRTYDSVRPSITSLSSTAPNQTKDSPIPVTVTFSESVTGFTSGDVSIGNGSISGFSGSGANYSFNVTPSGQGSVTVNIAQNVAQDAAGNLNTAATQLSRTYDSLQPIVSLSSTAPSSTNTSPIPVTVTFSESVTGFISGDVTVSNGTISGFSGSGASYSFNVTPSAQGAVTINVDANKAQDAAGNNNTAASQLSKTYDTQAPTDPSGLTLTAVSSSQIDLNWTVSTDTVSGLAGYKIERAPDNNGSPGTFAQIDTSATNSYSNSSLDINTKYWYRVRAYDSAGNDSNYTTNASKYTLAATPGIPTFGVPTTGQINVIIDPSANPLTTTEYLIQVTVGVDNYYVNKVSGDLQSVESWGTYSEFGSNLGQDVNVSSASASYTFRIKARNADNPQVETLFSDPATKYPAVNAPTLPLTTATANSLNVSWTAPVNGADHYHVYRDGISGVGTIVYNPALGDQTVSFTNSSLSGNTAYTYYIYSVNGGDEESTDYAQISSRTLAAAPSITANSNTSTWYGAGYSFIFTRNSTDNPWGEGGVSSFRYAFETSGAHTWLETESDWSLTDSNSATTSDTLTLSAPSQSGSYYLNIKSYNSDGDSSVSQESSYGPYKVDRTAPNAAGWVIENGGNGISFENIALQWGAPTDLPADANSGISGYNIYRSTGDDIIDGDTSVGDLPASPTFGASPINTSLETGTTYSDTGLQANRWYAYRIRTYDNSTPTANSTDSTIIWAKTRKATDPYAASITNLSTPDGDTSPDSADYDSTVGHNVTITFSGGASRSDAVNKYEIYRSTSATGTYSKVGEVLRDEAKTGGTINTVTYDDDETGVSLTFTDTSLTDNTNYYYKIKVVDVIASGPDAGTYTTESTSSGPILTKDATAPTDTSAVEVADIQSNLPGGPRRLVISWPRIDTTVAQNADFNQYKLYRSVTGLDGSWGNSIYLGTDNYFLDPDAGQTYYYKVSTTDDANHVVGVSAVDNESSGAVSTSINPAAIDRTAPLMAEPSVSALANSATVNLSFDEASDAIVELGTTSGTYPSGVTKTTRATTQSINLTKLIPGASYHYRVIARDASGNKLTSSDYTFETPAFALSNIDKSTSVTSATIKWNANATANSFVRYTNTKTDEIKIVANNEMKEASEEHSLALKGLAAGTQYNLQIVSQDEYSNEATSSSSFTTDEFKINDVAAETTASTATITWKTNEDSDSFVKHGISSAGEKEDGTSDITKNHSITLSNLKPNTKYKFKVKSKDAFNNTSTSSEASFETKPFQITDIETLTSTNSAIVTWKTNIEATSLVEYKSSDKDESSVGGDAEYTKEHSVEIKNLKSSTAYSFKLKSLDKDENTAESEGILTFKTKSTNTGFSSQPTASKVDEQELTATSAKISWQTAVATSSWVEYGFDTKYGKLAGNDTLTVDHIVTLENLTPGKTYHYRVKGVDIDGNEYVSGDNTFTALVVPKIAGSPKVKVTNKSATVTWASNTGTDSSVEYGLTSKYGDSAGSGVIIKTHTVEIKELAQDATYHYRIGGVDKFGNKALSNDFTFKTLKDTDGPKVSDVRSELLRSADEAGSEKISLIVNFTTDEEATSYVEYAEGISSATYSMKTRTNNVLNLSHSVLIEGLKPATTYHYRVVTKDKYGNITKSSDKSILTPKESATILQRIIRVLEETFGWIGNLRDYLQGKGKYKK